LDVTTRTRTASQLFGSLRKSLFCNPDISLSAKAAVYIGLIRPIALYGSESWCLTAKDKRMLTRFQNGCVRAMTNVSARSQRSNFISSSSLHRRLGIAKISTICARNELRWAGHVARMDWSRLPRKFISSWCRYKRPTGAPKLTYGRHLHQTLRTCNIENWHQRAMDRSAWRNLVCSL
jgi:hypothetical protein